MKPLLKYLLMAMLCLPCVSARSQGWDLGIDLGASGFLGDLGGANYIGRPLFFDLETSLVRPATSLHARYYMTSHFALKGSLTYTIVQGDDGLIQPKEEYSPEWYRWYRNLSFQSDILEGSLTAELNFTRFDLGSKRNRFAPYIFGGIGVFHFNPKTLYNGSLVELKPLRTEGQGFDSLGRKEYSLTQPVIPVGLGLRYNISPALILGFEYRHTLTFTDYIDDVSTTYVSQDAFNNYFQNDPLTAQTAYDLSVRADEKSDYPLNGSIVAPGEQRGDPTKKDSYILLQFSFSYIIANNSKYSSGFGKSHRYYPHGLKNTSDNFKKKKRLQKIPD
jgi:hypothetical protein